MLGICTYVCVILRFQFSGHYIFPIQLLFARLLTPFGEPGSQPREDSAKAFLHFSLRPQATILRRRHRTSLVPGWAVPLGWTDDGFGSFRGPFVFFIFMPSLEACVKAMAIFIAHFVWLQFAPSHPVCVGIRLYWRRWTFFPVHFSPFLVCLWQFLIYNFLCEFIF